MALRRRKNRKKGNRERLQLSLISFEMPIIGISIGLSNSFTIAQKLEQPKSVYALFRLHIGLITYYKSFAASLMVAELLAYDKRSSRKLRPRQQQLTIMESISSKTPSILPTPASRTVFYHRRYIGHISSFAERDSSRDLCLVTRHRGTIGIIQLLYDADTDKYYQSDNFTNYHSGEKICTIQILKGLYPLNYWIKKALYSDIMFLVLHAKELYRFSNHQFRTMCRDEFNYTLTSMLRDHYRYHFDVLNDLKTIIQASECTYNYFIKRVVEQRLSILMGFLESVTLDRV